MRQVRASQTNFTAGEIDPRLKSRVDVSRYYNGAALLKNVLVAPQGGLRRRPGMRALRAIGSTAGCQMVPFAFNTGQSYAFCFVSLGFYVWLADGTYIGFQGGAAPWNDTQAAQLNFAQAADTLLLFHPAFPPQLIRRGATDSDWTLSTAPLANIPQFAFGNGGSGALNPAQCSASATTGTVTISCSANVFNTNMGGWEISGNGGKAVITAFISASQVTARVVTAFANTSLTPDWVLTEPMISTARGWPECGTFHQGRLYMAGLASRPSTVIGSVVADFFNFDQGTGLDDRAVVATLDTDQVNAIHQLHSGRSLLLMTSGAEHAVIATPPITPKNLAIQEQTRRGIKRYVKLAEVDGALLFVQRGGAAIRQFVFVDTEQAYRSDLLSLLAPHLIRDPVSISARKGAATDDADHVVIVLQDGTATVLTTLRAQEVTAFTRWETDGQILSACALVGGEVFFAVSRGGQVVVERWEEAHLLDSSVRVVAPGTTTITGLAHLNGRTVALYGDASYLGTATVAGGSVTLPRSVTMAEAGLPPDVRVRTLPFEPKDPTGNLMGRKARITEVTLRVQDTGALTVQGRQVVNRKLGTGSATPLDSPPPVLTGDVKLRGLVGWQERLEVEIAQPVPAPMQLLALAYDAMIET